MWRVITGQHESIQLSFLLVDHTKFSPDHFFGLLKKNFRRSTVCTIYDIAQVVSLSSNHEQHIPQLIRGMDGQHKVPFYKWSACLSNYFKSIPSILSYHNFSVNDSCPGTVCLREHSDGDEVRINIMRRRKNADLSTLSTLPKAAVIPGLDLQRQWYRYKNIRQHCKSTLSVDITCPKPSQEKPLAAPPLGRKHASAGTPSEEVLLTKRVKKCSVCI